MEDHLLEKWQKIKIALEQANKTDCFFYKQACKACRGEPLIEPLQRLNCTQMPQIMTERNRNYKKEYEDFHALFNNLAFFHTPR